MHYPNLAAAPRRLSKGPLALVMIEDEVEVEGTLRHLARFGFRHLLAFCAPQIALPEGLPHLVRIDYDTTAERALQSALNGFGAAAGFGLVLVLFAAMRERIAYADVPGPFQGAAIGLVTAGLMALAFMGFSGLANL